VEHSDDTRLVTISGAEYDLLSQASAELTALITAEVDKWDGYEAATGALADTKWRDNA